MVDKNIITSRIEAIENHLARISASARMSKQEFLADLDAQDIVEYNLFQIVNHLIDMIQHIVVDENIGFPFNRRNSVRLARRLRKGSSNPAYGILYIHYSIMPTPDESFRCARAFFSEQRIFFSRTAGSMRKGR